MNVVFRILVVSAALVLCLAIPATGSAGGGCHASSPEVGAGSLVTVRDLAPTCFSPAVLHVAPGTEVTFRNPANGTPHDLSMVGFYSDLPPGREVTQAFETPGVYPFACRLHVGMVGAVVVGEPVPPAASAEAREVEPGSNRTALALGAGGIGVLASVSTAAWFLRRR